MASSSASKQAEADEAMNAYLETIKEADRATKAVLAVMEAEGVPDDAASSSRGPSPAKAMRAAADDDAASRRTKDMNAMKAMKDAMKELKKDADAGRAELKELKKDADAAAPPAAPASPASTEADQADSQI